MTRRGQGEDTDGPPAAREPGTYGRDDQVCSHQVVVVRVSPQWSPALTAGMTLKESCPCAAICPPQWSPALTAGMTRTHRPGPSGRAAMEPGTYGRDDLDGAAAGEVPRLAAIEPGSYGGDYSGTSTLPPT